MMKDGNNMDENHILEQDELNSMIGPGTRFKGEFNLDGLLRIDGDFSGIIRTKGMVLVGRNGRAECQMHAGKVVVGGIVKGDIISSEKVTILSTGLVIGNITSPRLIIQEGVVFNGICQINTQLNEAESEALPSPVEILTGMPPSEVNKSHTTDFSRNRESLPERENSSCNAETVSVGK